MKTGNRLHVGTWFLVLVLAAPVWAEDLFEDPNLEKAVRRQVHAKRDHDKPLTKKDVQSISTIDGRGLGIQSLKGIEHCRALAALDLSDNKISDLSPLADLKRLQSLTLADNAIADVDPLASLEGLQYLDLSGNRIADLKPLKNLKRLNSLYLSRNRIKDVAPLGGLDRVWSLHLDGNPLQSGLSAVGGMKWLETLGLKNCGLKDLDFLDGARRLRLLILQDNKIRDLSPLVQAVEADEEDRFAPFLRVYLQGNPLDARARSQQMQQLQGAGVRGSWK